MTTFTTTDLSDDRVLVVGRDSVGAARQCILDAKEYVHFWSRDIQLAAAADFDRAVEEFFAPLTEAAEKVEAAAKEQHDSAFYVVVQEATPGSEAKREILHKLAKDTVVLRMLRDGNTDRLIWVGDVIEILAMPQPVPELHYDEAKDYVGNLDADDAVDLNGV